MARCVPMVTQYRRGEQLEEKVAGWNSRRMQRIAVFPGFVAVFV
ncbi:MAG: hypothetical protein ACLQVJ_06185 [Syntrophobacteraceae bacterium]